MVFNSIADYVDTKAIHLQMNATDWVDVVALMSCRLLAGGNVQPAFVQSVMTREQADPTGVRLKSGLCVALPRTDPELVLRPCLALATLARPVLFGSIGDPAARLPVRLVIMAASSDQAGHVRALSRIAGMFQGTRTIENLVDAQSIAYVAAAICNSRDALVATSPTGQLADDLRFMQ